jgi:ATP-dependent HslUV protease ATP-binding subunit HslU
MIAQQRALLATEGISLEFTDAAIREIAKVAEEVNSSVDNIGARRLHTILERIVEDVSFDAPERAKEGNAHVVFDAADVRTKIDDLLKKQDLSKYVL